ncbi:hypothetical protein [Alloscardovia criceti]|uniref:hypothetical protein n=1 Tax=Alloscardovia criceti TaxID=356828 RepID=UPI00036504E9|nr:hypothetical protein [Alloscardovia criceti]
MAFMEYERLRQMNQRAVYSFLKDFTPVELVVGLISALKSGLSLHSALAMVGKKRVQTSVLDTYAIRSLVRRRVRDTSFHKEALRTRFISELYAVCKLSEIAGCSAVHCLEILNEDMKRTQERESRKNDATAIARMTIKILLGLPLLVLSIGGITGSDSLQFLFSTPVGVGCLTSSGMLYIVGTLWAQSLLRKFEHQSAPCAAQIAHSTSMRS